MAATLPASVAALSGIPVHVITANDYLVERDAEAMGPIYARLGITVGSVVEREQSRQARRAAYACDVTYVTNKQVAFDYLRDRLQGAGVATGLVVPYQAGEKPVGTAGELIFRWYVRRRCIAIAAEEAGGASLLQDALEQLREPRVGATVHAFGTTQELQQPAGQVTGAPVGVPAAPVRPLQVHHDEIHAVHRVAG